MARLALPAIIMVLMLGPTSALTFDVNIDQVTSHSAKGTEYKQNVTDVQEINLTMENVGSIGCTYRLKGRFQEGSKTYERFSTPSELWPGDFSFMEIKYIPINYTGEVKSNLSVEYCGRKEKLTEYSFTVNENTTVNKEVKSRTIESTETKAKIVVENGTSLVPKKEPPYWKTSSTSIDNGTAVIEYDAPIFDKKRTITYIVLKEGHIIGKTDVSLEPQPTLKEKILDRKTELLGVLLTLSIIINLLLAAKHKGLIKKAKNFDYQLPDFRKEKQ